MFEWFDVTGEEPTKRYDAGFFESWAPAPDTEKCIAFINYFKKRIIL